MSKNIRTQKNNLSISNLIKYPGQKPCPFQMGLLLQKCLKFNKRTLYVTNVFLFFFLEKKLSKITEVIFEDFISLCVIFSFRRSLPKLKVLPDIEFSIHFNYRNTYLPPSSSYSTSDSSSSASSSTINSSKSKSTPKVSWAVCKAWSVNIGFFRLPPKKKTKCS